MGEERRGEVSGENEKKAKCRHCGREFVKIRVNQEFCTRNCANLEWQRNNPEKANASTRRHRAKVRADNTVEKTCQKCGKTFKTHSMRIRFCSLECRLAYFKREYMRRRRASERENATKKLVCATCGKTFLSHKTNVLYCSPECYGIGHAKSRKEAQNRRKDKQKAARMHEVVCKHCGTKFTTSKSNKFYCSLECQEANRHGQKKTRAEKPSKETILRHGGLLTPSQMDSVLADLALPAEERFAASQNWTKAMHRYAARVWAEKTGCRVTACNW